jgi:hypothetical protein
MPVAAENEPGTRSTWGQLQEIELRFINELNLLQAQFNGARLHYLFHLPVPKHCLQLDSNPFAGFLCRTSAGTMIGLGGPKGQRLVHEPLI